MKGHYSHITGDVAVLHAARQEARAGFRKNAAMSPDDPSLASAIAHAEDVARFLKENVVQGKHEGEDKYSEDPFLLFHEETLKLEPTIMWAAHCLMI